MVEYGMQYLIKMFYYTTGTKYLELGNIFANTQPIHDLLSADIDKSSSIRWPLL